MNKAAELDMKHREGSGTIMASTVRLYVDMLRLAGLDETRLCAAANLDMSALNDPNGRISRNALFRLYSLAASEGRYSLSDVEFADAGFLGVVGYSMMTSATFEKALQRLVRYAALLDDELEMWLEEENGHLRLCAKLISEVNLPDEFVATGLKGIIGFCKILLGEFPEINEVGLRNKAPNENQLKGVSSARVAYGMPYYSVLFDAQDLSKPLRTSNEQLDRLHVDIADMQLANMNTPQSIAFLRKHIVKSLCGKAPTLESLAKELGISRRTLQRSLEQQGTRFKEILDDTRRQRARHYLQYSGKGMKEVAWHLGFAELSSFYRACQRWFGMTPRQYRQAYGMLDTEQAATSSAVATHTGSMG